MFKIKVNDHYNFEINQEQGKTYLEGEEVTLDVVKGTGDHLHVIRNNKSYRVEVEYHSPEEKKLIIKVNGNSYSLSVKDQYDELLHQLGLDNLNVTKVAELKAPMPGLVLKILVSEGDEIKKGDNILVLEAMKMENIIKSPADVIIKSVKVKPSDKVEKNQVMVLFI